MLSENFGTELKAIRVERGLSLRAVGEAADLDHAYVSRLESGDCDSPSEDTLAKLSAALGVMLCAGCGLPLKKHWSVNFSDGQHVSGETLICPASVFRQAKGRGQ